MSITFKGITVQPDSDLAAKLDDSLLADYPLAFESPESSLVVRADYTPGQHILTVELRAGRVTKAYDYVGVKPSEWVDFYEATSKGSAFRRLKALYNGRPRA